MVEEDDKGKEVVDTLIDATARASSTFILKVVNDVGADLIGLAGGDWLSEVRKRNRIRLANITRSYTVDLDAEPQEPSPSVVKPIIEAAQDESRAEILELFGRLLTSSFSGAQDELRREYVEVVQNMTPNDARTILL